MTKRENLNKLYDLAVQAQDFELQDFVSKEIEHYNAKLEKSKAYRSKNAKVNDSIKENILNVIAEAKNIDEINEAMGTAYSTQKMGALLSQLIKNGEIEKIATNKRGEKTQYRKVDAE